MEGMLHQSFSFITDETLSIKHWDEGAADISQKSASTVLGMKYYDVFPKILVNDEDALLVSLRSGNELVIKDYCFRCIHGQVKADLLLSSAKSGNGTSADVKVVITPLHACPMEEKLKDAQRFIDIGKTASVLAHGVRNPLNAIKGSVVYLRTKYAGEPTLIEFTNIMEEEIARLDKFISQFLSRSLSDIELSNINVNELLNKIRAFISLQTHSANIESSFEFGDCPDIMVNAFQLEQAVLNVINNAIEAMNPSGGQLRVRTMMEKRFQVDFVVIEISDTGSGMSDSAAARAKKDDGNRGRGFGLPIAREMLQHYGGTIEINSEKNKGTAVRLFLPVLSGPV
jgi:two-component system, NtrC family, nitrogen regulation sensor histidine kinase GlnL